MKLKTAQDTKPHEFCKTLSEFALEYRTIRQRALETKKRKENQKKRTKTRGKLITDVSNLWELAGREGGLSFSLNIYFPNILYYRAPHRFYTNL